MENGGRNLRFSLIFCLLIVGFSYTDPNDLSILLDFRKGLDNPELLKWPKEEHVDPCGDIWPHVVCVDHRVTQIQVQNIGLSGTLPPNFNNLSKLINLGLQRNKFHGPLPTFRGLSELQYTFLDYNRFDSIPSDFFVGLTNLRVLALDANPLNASTGWSLPEELKNSVQLANLSAMQCNLMGNIPEYLGSLQLTSLMLSYNELSGEIPSTFRQSPLQILWLNEQDGLGLTGTLDIITSITSLSQLWLQGNKFSGLIPENISELTSLQDLNLNGNQLVGRIPQSLTAMKLKRLDLNNNLLMGSIPEFLSSNVTYSNNPLCVTKPGANCSQEVNWLIDFLAGVNYPHRLASQWVGDDACAGPWVRLSCNSGEVTIINMPNLNLTGNISSSLGNIESLVEIRLQGNNLTGSVPGVLTQLKSLRLLNVSENNLSPPIPSFAPGVRVITNGNPLLLVHSTQSPPSSSPSPAGVIAGVIENKPKPPSSSPKVKSMKKVEISVAVAAAATSAMLVPLSLLLWRKKNKKNKKRSIESLEDVKVPISSSFTWSSSKPSSHTMESGNVISVQVLRTVTGNFAPEKELGRGGFGVVYQGELEDGVKVAVKRMESGVIGTKALDEFQSEIAVLSKVRHRHLVSLLGYAVEGSERLVVYEFMSMGALSKHLFEWKEMNMEPLSWKKRLIIALDVARGVEYLHALARESFIHRDLKSSNILLDDDFRAKVSDFGLVKLAPDRERSVATKLAGTFGYLAPEYAVMGKVTTKADVYSYGVVLMELLTGLTALDEGRSEERRYLAEWFGRMKSSKAKLMEVIDPTMRGNAEIFSSLGAVMELAGHCTARDPNRRPEMGHAVNVLSPLVEKWNPCNVEEEGCGIDYNLPLTDMVKCWQQAEGGDKSYSSLDDSQGSIPVRPLGFAESFTSSDGR